MEVEWDRVNVTKSRVSEEETLWGGGAGGRWSVVLWQVRALARS